MLLIKLKWYINPLVSTGLIPSNLGDILVHPAEAVSQPRRRVIKAHVLTRINLQLYFRTRIGKRRKQPKRMR